jgi:hypothetical protein
MLFEKIKEERRKESRSIEINQAEAYVVIFVGGV